MILNLLLLTVGMALIYFGAEGLVWGGSRLASYFRVSPIVIGLSVVAFGTSLPEFTVSLYSTLQGVPDIAVGNIIGSNIANVSLILALSAIIFPVIVDYQRIRNDVLIVIGVTILFISLSYDGVLSRFDGGLLVIGILLYIGRLIRSPIMTRDISIDQSQQHVIHYISGLVLGLCTLALGTYLFTESSVAIALYFGVSELVIGATIVAIGTSLPELATSLIAAFRKHSEIVLGNILGSNVFNLMAVLGVVPLIKPLEVPTNAIMLQIPLMLVLTVVIWPVLKFQQGVKRSTGLGLLAVYLVFFSCMFYAKTL